MKHTVLESVISKCLIGLFLSLQAAGSYAGMAVQCRIDSQQFLDAEIIDKYTESYNLTAPATQDGGRYLAFNNKNYELWVKTHAYVKDEKGLSVTAYSAVLIDKISHSMSEATSFKQGQTNRAELTVHKLAQDFKPSSRLIFSCADFE